MGKKEIIRKFWETRASLTKSDKIGPLQATSLTTTEEAAEHRRKKDLESIIYAINKSNCSTNLLLDIGCGVGRITIELADIFKKIYASDYISEFIEIAKKSSKSNIHFFQAEAHEFDRSIPYDCCLMSGLLNNLTNEEMHKTVNAISYIPYVVLKESVGTFGRFELNDDHYSKELGTTYTSIYRSTNEIIDLFFDYGFVPVYTEVIERHRKETNIHIFLFEKTC